MRICSSTNPSLIEEGLNCILSHLEEPHWPRTISTKTTANTQIKINIIEEALEQYRSADGLDCKINAYPYR
jgi:hypothetical protein